MGEAARSYRRRRGRRAGGPCAQGLRRRQKGPGRSSAGTEGAPRRRCRGRPDRRGPSSPCPWPSCHHRDRASRDRALAASTMLARAFLGAATARGASAVAGGTEPRRGLKTPEGEWLAHHELDSIARLRPDLRPSILLHMSSPFRDSSRRRIRASPGARTADLFPIAGGQEMHAKKEAPSGSPHPTRTAVLHRNRRDKPPPLP